MKKSWIVLLLTPIISFAAYPVFESETDDFEGSELVFEAPDSEEQAQEIAEVEELEGELALLLDEEFTKLEPVNEGLAQATPLTEENSEAAAIQSKQAAIGQKRAPVKRNSASKAASVPRQKIKDARSNSNRPRVTHREDVKAHTPSVDKMEADAHTESKHPVQKSSPKSSASPSVELKAANSPHHRVAAPQATAPATQQKPAVAPQKKA
ncbi:MAG: hypothetical protein HYX67_12955, partial [Candidatus Melainabacteria bacterium]|nr:hypothetical protein [Candidatus Melainabacteria bacterium]